MNRKIYAKPAVESVEAQHESNILVGSLGVETGDILGDDYDDGDVSYSNSKNSNYWEDKGEYNNFEW